MIARDILATVIVIASLILFWWSLVSVGEPLLQDGIHIIGGER